MYTTIKNYDTSYSNTTLQKNTSTIKNNLKSYNLKEILLKYISVDDYDAMMKRVDDL